ncbi:putative 2-dehydropantoate 2-reductase [Candida tropicalis]
MSSPLKIHILGVGSIGSLVAHDLKRAFPSLVTPILLLRPDSLANPSPQHQIHLTRIKNNQLITSNIETPSAKPPNVKETIENLIISTKTGHTIEALRPYVPQIKPSTNILILQNGMGMSRTLLDKFWSSSISRPNIFEGSTTHGAYIQDGIVQHVASGTISLSEFPGNNPHHPERFLSILELPDMIKYILDAPELNASFHEYNKFLLIQVEKLIVNCCINALTALFDCKNGELLYSNDISFLWKKIINEAKLVLVQEYSMLNDVEEAKQFLDTDRLLNKVIGVADLTKANSSSMRQDIRNLRITEIENLNGFIGLLGRKHNLGVPLNVTLTSLIRSKLAIERGIDQAAAAELLMEQ